MKRISQLLVGYRGDLDQFWWHRLATVVLALAMIAVFAIVTRDHIDDQPPSSPLSDVTLDINLSQFLGWTYTDGAHSKLEEFPMLDYFEGIQQGDRIVEANPFSFFVDECEVVTPSPYGGNPVVKCSQGLSTPDKTFRYKLNSTGLGKAWLRAGAIAFGVCAGLMLVAVNLYYRGLIYILRGPR